MSQFAPVLPWVSTALHDGLAIPAHPLALTKKRKLDERRQRALTRYYHASGAGGIAVGVHTTQFAIRSPKHTLFKPVLELARQTVSDRDAATKRQTVYIAGICGRTSQAVREARFARETGYHIGLLSLAALKDEDDWHLIEHSRAVAQEISLMGFYLQPAVGGRMLSRRFWQRFVEIPNVVAIKIAPFNRYQTLDVIQAVAEAGRARDIALYTGNDDHIILDLLTRYKVSVGHKIHTLKMSGGLLGHWACWTEASVKIFEICKALREDSYVHRSLLTLAEQITDSNAAFFDAANEFKGCIAGIHEVLRRQGLLANTLCLDQAEGLSRGQKEDIDRVYRAYPFLCDDDFVAAHLDEWLDG